MITAMQIIEYANGQIAHVVDVVEDDYATFFTLYSGSRWAAAYELKGETDGAWSFVRDDDDTWKLRRSAALRDLAVGLHEAESL